MPGSAINGEVEWNLKEGTSVQCCIARFSEGWEVTKSNVTLRAVWHL